MESWPFLTHASVSSALQADLELGVLSAVFGDNINQWIYLAKVVTPSQLRLVKPRLVMPSYLPAAA